LARRGSCIHDLDTAATSNNRKNEVDNGRGLIEV